MHLAVWDRFLGLRVKFYILHDKFYFLKQVLYIHRVHEKFHFQRVKCCSILDQNSRWPIQKEEVSVMMKKDNDDDDDDDDDDLCNEMMTWEINNFPKH